MKREEKILQVEKLHKEFLQSKSAVLLDYKGLNVAEITALRNKLREAAVDFKVVKNTLSVIASKGTDLEQIKSFFAGPTATAIARDNPIDGFKALEDFIKDNPKLEYKVALLEGTIIGKDDISKIAKLPSKEELLSRFLGTMQAPVAGFVRVMAGNLTGLLNVLNGIKDSKENN